ncbi:MAG: heme exporter protein CcmD [Gammaproteobacteria bacterium]|nr:heme exporter protein CcmD [Gammaproteobacteria bacterium]
MTEFFAMGGYAFYVWGSFGVFALCVLIEVVAVRQRKRTIFQRLGRMIRLEVEVKNEK